MSRLLNWFTTKDGRRFTHACVGLTGFSIIGFQLAIHGPLQEKVKKMCQIYSDGKARRLSPDVKQLVDTVLVDSQLKSAEKKKIKFFNVIGQDLFHSGDISSPYGAMIGIPFQFEDLNNVNFGKLRLEGQDSIDWIVDGQDLLAAMRLSDKAKKFAIMREIHSCSIWTTLDNAFISAGAFVFAGELARRINIKRNAFEKSLKGRLKTYFLCYTFCFFMYRCLRDPLKHIVDMKYDNLAAATGLEYLEGGIEFYEKALARNKALRKLMGARGERKFDKNGDKNYFLFTPRLPLRKRLEYLQDIHKEIQTVTV